MSIGFREYDDIPMREFAEMVKRELLEGDYLSDIKVDDIKIEEVLKNNGLKLTGMVILSGERNMAPNIYLNENHFQYCFGRSMNDICNEISGIYMECINTVPNIENAKELFKPDNLFVKLVNYEANKTMLADCIYEKHNDLALVVRVLYDKRDDGIASTVFKKKDIIFFEDWTEEEIMICAKENTKELFPTVIRPLRDVVEEITDDIELMSAKGIYVISNDMNINGAVAIYDSETMEKYFGPDKELVIVPSSIHECILIDKEVDYEEASEMTKSVNENTVCIEERLSDNVYSYNTTEKEIKQQTGLERSKEEPDLNM